MRHGLPYVLSFNNDNSVMEHCLKVVRFCKSTFRMIQNWDPLKMTLAMDQNNGQFTDITGQIFSHVCPKLSEEWGDHFLFS